MKIRQPKTPEEKAVLVKITKLARAFTKEVKKETEKAGMKVDVIIQVIPKPASLTKETKHGRK